MKAKTELFLYALLWTFESVSRPNWRNLRESFEAWAYRTGIGRQIAQLERLAFLEELAAKASQKVERVVRLTASGRLHALGGRDPETWWNRPWDGRWRLVLFDLPNAQSRLRDRLRDHLRQHGFGGLQKSVWISPDPLPESKSFFARIPINVRSLIMLEGRPSGGETDAEIVAGTWDFEEINQGYAHYLRVLKARPVPLPPDEAGARQFLDWAGRERMAWLAAISADPLLPKRLWPAGYLGLKAWEVRGQTTRQIAGQIRAFRLQLFK